MPFDTSSVASFQGLLAQLLANQGQQQTFGAAPISPAQAPVNNAGAPGGGSVNPDLAAILQHFGAPTALRRDSSGSLEGAAPQSPFTRLESRDLGQLNRTNAQTAQNQAELAQLQSQQALDAFAPPASARPEPAPTGAPPNPFPVGAGQGALAPPPIPPAAPPQFTSPVVNDILNPNPQGFPHFQEGTPNKPTLDSRQDHLDTFGFAFPRTQHPENDPEMVALRNAIASLQTDNAALQQHQGQLQEIGNTLDSIPAGDRPNRRQAASALGPFVPEPFIAPSQIRQGVTPTSSAFIPTILSLLQQQAGDLAPTPFNPNLKTTLF